MDDLGGGLGVEGLEVGEETVDAGRAGSNASVD